MREVPVVGEFTQVDAEVVAPQALAEVCQLYEALELVGGHAHR
ncbi:hypothetical protein [Streptomyces sp. NPDC051662]